jgi:hypothetical protein
LAAAIHDRYVVCGWATSSRFSVQLNVNKEWLAKKELAGLQRLDWLLPQAKYRVVDSWYAPKDLTTL